MSLRNAQNDVRDFHVKFDCGNPDKPIESIDVTSSSRRLDWIIDEVEEGAQAVYQGQADQLADAYVDIIYFALGGLVEMGIDAAPLWDAVHAANIAKVKIQGIAKIQKPAGWTAPDIASLIEAQRKTK